VSASGQLAQTLVGECLALFVLELPKLASTKKIQRRLMQIDTSGEIRDPEKVVDLKTYKRCSNDDVASVEFREESFDKVEGSLNKTGEEQIGKVDVPRWEAETLASRHNMGI